MGLPLIPNLNRLWLTRGWQYRVRATVCATHTHTTLFLSVSTDRKTADNLHNHQTRFVSFLCVSVSLCLSFSLSFPHTYFISLSLSWLETKQRKKEMVIFSPPPSSFLYFLLSSLTARQWIKHQDGGLRYCHCFWWDSRPTLYMQRRISSRTQDLFPKHVQERCRWWREEEEVRRLAGGEGSKEMEEEAGVSNRPPLTVLWMPLCVLFLLHPLCHSSTSFILLFLLALSRLPCHQEKIANNLISFSWKSLRTPFFFLLCSTPHYRLKHYMT